MPNGLVQKMTLYKGKYFKSPQQEQFARLLELYKWQMEEKEKSDKKE
jgi:hypothetical protein